MCVLSISTVYIYLLTNVGITLGSFYPNSQFLFKFLPPPRGKRKLLYEYSALAEINQYLDYSKQAFLIQVLLFAHLFGLYGNP
jgi:hypothetical protein